MKPVKVKVKLVIFLGLFMGLAIQTFAQGSAALTVMEGETGRALITKAIQNSPAAREFFAGILGVKAEKLMAMDPVLRQTQIMTRLNAKAADQKVLIQKAEAFIQSAKTSATDISLGGGASSGSANSEEVFGGVTPSKAKRLPLPSPTTTTSGVKSESMLVNFTNQLVGRGEITETQGQEFQTAVLGTDIEGNDVIRCITQWKQPANRALYVRTIIAGAKAMPDGKAALEAISDSISRELGVSSAEAKRRACALAGAGNVSCNAYGEPILRACL